MHTFRMVGAIPATNRSTTSPWQASALCRRTSKPFPASPSIADIIFPCSGHEGFLRQCRAALPYAPINDTVQTTLSGPIRHIDPGTRLSSHRQVALPVPVFSYAASFMSSPCILQILSFAKGRFCSNVSIVVYLATPANWAARGLFCDSRLIARQTGLAAFLELPGLLPVLRRTVVGATAR